MSDPTNIPTVSNKRPPEMEVCPVCKRPMKFLQAIHRERGDRSEWWCEEDRLSLPLFKADQIPVNPYMHLLDKKEFIGTDNPPEAE